MRRFLLLVAAAVLFAEPAAASDLGRHFRDAGTSGTMVVERSGPHPRTWVVGGRRASERFLPSSTFKIPNALLAIDRHVASGASQPYPGPNPNFVVDGAPFLPAVCEGDLTLTTALVNSCIPIFQGIARAIGLPAFERAVKRFDYGNENLRGAVVDRFWLDGPLAISAREQVDFLQRLERGALPVSRRAQREVREMLVLQRDRCATLYGKTGYVFTTTPRAGWWVGWLENGRATWTFALNLDITRPEHAAARVTIGKTILQELGAKTTC